ncbi:MAG: hypothetical protein JOY98_08525 [Candidatus Eremiobacteraeota bacterium]|nr:hypothetical protein [Candidatus Eremiobacteraeota bacterium]
MTQSAGLRLETPVMADAFVESLGVNTHLTNDLTADGKYSVIVHAVRELGIRHVRDGIFPVQTAAQYDDERRFFAATHATMLAITDCPKPLGYFPGAQTPPKVVRTFDAAVGHPIDYLEGPNEPDLRHVKDWAPLTKTCIARDDAGKALAVPYVASAMGDPLDAPKLGSIAALVDIGGIHRYFSGHNPGTTGFAFGGACGRWMGMAWSICEARVNAGPAAPLFVTETGYTTVGKERSSSTGIGMVTVGKYISRVLFIDSLAGIARTYLYELHDDGTDASNAQDGYGLIEYDGTPKPSFYAVRSIVRALSDRGPAFTPSPLRYGVSGKATIDHELFAKRDGEYVVAIWNEVPGWNPATKKTIVVPPSTVTLTFTTRPSRATFEVLDDGGMPSSAGATLRGNSVTIAVDDHLGFLRLRF